MFDCFKGDVTFKICELDCDAYIKQLKENNELIEQKVAELSDSSSNKKKKETMHDDTVRALKGERT